MRYFEVANHVGIVRRGLVSGDESTVDELKLAIGHELPDFFFPFIILLTEVPSEEGDVTERVSELLV